MTEPVIVSGARNLIGRFVSGFSDLTAEDLGGVAVTGALERSGVAGGPCM